ncbi:hypothetical protein GWI33_000003 [Rhynchophorus ferrugineus]|uniref:PCI domain-containing protein 2 homolog n=1 Tax=Rhynchophorus ferrugineus TaxID=354439 RepID=A0A834ML91_RHYFE|nr:hypothetical protein GWI33_000003 [Rhynchophorus ferrugineus]
MTFMNVANYLQIIDRSWRSCNGQTVSMFVSIRHDHAKYRNYYIENPENMVEKFLPAPVDELVIYHLKCLYAISMDDFLSAYQFQTGLVQAFTKILQAQKEENWSLPIMNVVCSDLRFIAQQAEKQRVGVSEKPGEFLEKAADSLMGCFRICAGDTRTDNRDTKRKGMLALVVKLCLIVIIKRQIMKILLGYIPNRKVLEKYNVLEFWDLVQAVCQGNLKWFDEIMEKHESFFIACGIYLIVDKLKIIAYRNLFKKVYLILSTHQIPVESLQTALEFLGQDVDLDETQCIVANLINEGKIKGYISHQHRKVVVSKQNPFPPLTST